MLVEQKLPFYAQSRPFHWIDIGKVTDYWTVLQRVLLLARLPTYAYARQVRPNVGGLNTRVDWDSTVQIKGPVYIGSGQIDAGAVIEGPAWLGNGCVMRQGTASWCAACC